jgi:hypothetical protein
MNVLNTTTLRPSAPPRGKGHPSMRAASDATLRFHPRSPLPSQWRRSESVPVYPLQQWLQEVDAVLTDAEPSSHDVHAALKRLEGLSPVETNRDPIPAARAAARLLQQSKRDPHKLAILSAIGKALERHRTTRITLVECSEYKICDLLEDAARHLPMYDDAIALTQMSIAQCSFQIYTAHFWETLATTGAPTADAHTATTLLNTLVTLTHLEKAPPISPALWRILRDRLDAGADRLDAFGAARATWSIGQLAASTEIQLILPASVLSAVHRETSRMTERDISNTLIGLAALQVRWGGALRRQLLDGVIRTFPAALAASQRGNNVVQRAANVLTALLQLEGGIEEPVLGALLDVVEQRAALMAPEAISSALNSLIKLRVSLDSPAGAALLSALQLRLRVIGAEGVANTLWALATNGRRPQGAMSKQLLDAVVREAPRFSAQNSANAIFAFAKLRWVPSRAASGSLFNAVGRTAGGMDAQGVANTWFAVGELGLRPVGWSQGALAAAAVSHAPKMTPQAVCTALTAVGKLQLWPEEDRGQEGTVQMVSALVARAAAVLPEMEPPDVARLLWALAALAVAGWPPPRRLLWGLMERVVSDMRQDDLQLVRT